MSLVLLSIVVFAGVGLIAYGIGIYNGLIRLKHNVEQAWSNIDVLLKQRSDELPKLVDTVKGYIAHEREVLTAITEARAAVTRARTPGEQGQADGLLRSALGQLFAVAESYPELKADTSFNQLQSRISEIEEQIADRREFYNHSVNAINVRIEQIPDTFVASLMHLGPRELFEVSEADRRDVQVSFAS
jgi:LemA protein